MGCQSGSSLGGLRILLLLRDNRVESVKTQASELEWNRGKLCRVFVYLPDRLARPRQMPVEIDIESARKHRVKGRPSS